MTTLFGEHVVQKPCLSARLFASALYACPEVQTLSPLLQALVQTEALSLGQGVDATSKRVQFSGVDCSSTPRPVPRPVDRLEESREFMQTHNALVIVKQEIDRLDPYKTILAISSMVVWLEQLTLETAQEAAKTIHEYYQPKRLLKAAKSYHADFEILLHRHSTTTTHVQPFGNCGWPSSRGKRFGTSFAGCLMPLLLDCAVKM
jgi:hypothetical protein